MMAIEKTSVEISLINFFFFCKDTLKSSIAYCDMRIPKYINTKVEEEKGNYYKKNNVLLQKKELLQ